MNRRILGIALALIFCTTARAQVNSGSNGSDGALDFSAINYTTNVVIDMHDHPNGIYQYTYVNVPTNVTVSFIPNVNNTPVYWLVQNNVVVNGTVTVSGKNGTVYFTGGTSPSSGQGGLGGPGGYKGGDPAGGAMPPTSGQGPGGGQSGGSNGVGGAYNYGNAFLLPLLGGSGGGGGYETWDWGGGGGGAILIAGSSINITGSIHADSGGRGCGFNSCGGSGSGGAIRLVGSQIFGNGQVSAADGGRIRFDTYDNEFGGNVNGQFTSGAQFIIIPTSGQLPQLTVTSVGGVPVSPSPTGVLATPDAVLSAQQNNPIPIMVSCANLPLHSLITVSVKPSSGSPVSATGHNDTGTQTSSTATISINIPRGGGLIYATATTSN